MEYTFEQLQKFLIDTTEECTFEIENDFTEEEIKDFDKVKALEYLIENREYHDEWSGAGMFEAICRMWDANEKHTKKELDKLLEFAKNR